MKPGTSLSIATETRANADEARDQEAEAEVRELRLRFTGSAREYFRIWIVNVCLTLFTLGIFSAWAKVRKRRYLYSHTRLDGTPFQYLGRPWPILKGRLLAAALAALWWAADYTPRFQPFVVLVAAVLLPWFAVRSAAFHARSSAFRNISFDFSGLYRSAAKTLYGGVLLVVVTLGLALPYFRQRVTRYFIERTSYANERAKFRLRRNGFYSSHLTAVMIMLAGAILTVGAIVILSSHLRAWALPVALLPGYFAYAVALAHVRARMQNLIWNHTRLGPFEFRSRLATRRLALLYLGNALAIVASAGLLVPWAVIRTIKYQLGCLQVFQAGDVNALRGARPGAGSALGAEVGDLFHLELST